MALPGLEWVILGLFFLLGHRRRIAVVFFAFAFINLVIVLPLYFGGRVSMIEGEPTLRAMLLNVNTRLGDPARVRQVIEEMDPDILVLEEISSQWVRDLQWLDKTHPHSRVQPREDNFGIGLFCKLPLAESEIVYIADTQVPSIVATLNTGPNKLRMMATHPLPPSGSAYSRWRNNQLDQLPDYLHTSLPLVLLVTSM